MMRLIVEEELDRCSREAQDATGVPRSLALILKGIVAGSVLLQLQGP